MKTKKHRHSAFTASQTFIALATAAAVAMLANPAHAAVPENGAWSMQVDGLGIKSGMQNEGQHLFTGGGFIFNSPIENGSPVYNIERYGSPSYDPENPTKYVTKGDTKVSLTGNLLREAYASERGLQKPAEGFSIYGGGLVYQSAGAVDVIGSTSVTISEHTETDNDAFDVYGGGRVASNNGSATVSGDTFVTIQSVASPLSSVFGGGAVNSNTAGTGVADASVKGVSNVTVKDSVVGLVVGGSDVEGDGLNNGAYSTIEGTNITLVNSHVIALNPSDEGLAGMILGGSFVSTDSDEGPVGGVADVGSKGIHINLKDSSTNILVGGSFTGGYAESLPGKSAVVNGDIDIVLDHSQVNSTLIAGSVAHGNPFDEDWGIPDETGAGDGTVYGDVTVVLRNGTEVNDVYLSGYGALTDIDGTSTLVIADNTVKVNGAILGITADAEGNTSATSWATVQFGSQDSPYRGSYTGALKYLDEITSVSGSEVDLNIVNDMGRPTLIDPEYESSGFWTWLEITGEGTYTGKIALTKNNNLVLSSEYRAESVMLTDSRIWVAQGGTLHSDSLTLKGFGSIIVDGGILSTLSGQVFTNGLDANGTAVTDAGTMKYDTDHLSFGEMSGLVLNDAYYNTDYVASAKTIFGDTDTKVIVFTGHLVAADNPGPNTKVDINDLGSIENTGGTTTIHDKTDVMVNVGSSTSPVTIDKSFGVSTIIVEGDNQVPVTIDSDITLVGANDKSCQLIQGAGDVTISKTLSLGAAGSTANAGSISQTVTVASGGTLRVNEGTFDLTSLASEGGKLITTDKAELTIGTLKFAADTVAQLSAKATQIGQLVIDAATDAVHTITGAAQIQNLDVQGTGNVRIRVGNDTERGDVHLTAESLKGLNFYLDPTWAEGDDVTDASRLILDTDNVDGKVTVGHNSYAVIGGDTDDDFVALFKSGKLVWGNGNDATLAGLYVAKPITIAANGGILVDQAANGSETVTDGSITFGAKSVLVANISQAQDGQAFITASSATADASARAVLVGDFREGQVYKLFNQDDVFAPGQVTSGHSLWELDSEGRASLLDAYQIYGDTMQGKALANAGTLAGNSWVNGLLDKTDGSTTEQRGKKFDAAMNPAGSMTVFTTAFDRAADLRRAVQAEAAANPKPRLWAQITGGKTKLEGIATGGAPLDTETNASGLIVGGETTVNRAGDTFGVALTAGTGETENDAVKGKDDFDWYGLSFYGKTKTSYGIDVLADASLTVLKSDLTVGGKADVKTDTTSTVWSLGLQGRKSFIFAGVHLTPFAGMNVYHLRSDGYENGHGASVGESHATAVEFPVGAKVSKAFPLPQGFFVLPSLSVTVVPTVADREIDSTVKFAGASSTYNYTFADDLKVRTNFAVEARKGNFRFGLSAGYEWGSEERSATTLKARMKYLF